jgi:hypothetical protein
MNESISLLFYLKKPKNYTSGLVFIYSRITIESKRAEFSIGVKCLPEKWNSKGGKPLGNDAEAKSLQRLLDTVKTKVFDSYHRLIIKNAKITSESIKNEYFGVKEKPRTLIPIFQDHNDRIQVYLVKNLHLAR